MKIIFVSLALFCLLACAASDISHGVYLPPGGSLQAPGGGAAYRRNYATILRQDQDINDQGFHYNYETSDGTKAQQQGRVIPGATQDTGSVAVHGSFSYVGTDGQTYSIRYTADENGYRPEGAHLPTPPPIPEAIQRSLRLQGAGSSQSGQYQRSGSFNSQSGYNY